jgi:hypothetical protein
MRRAARVCLVLALPSVLAALGPAVASAQKKAPPPQGVTMAGSVKPDTGFLDDVFAFDGSGARLAIIRTDAASFAEIEVLQVADRTSVARFDVSKTTLSPVSLAFVGDGSQVLLVSRPVDADKSTAFLMDLTGKVVRKWGPGSDVVLTDVSGDPAVAVFDKAATKKGGFTYNVAVYDLETGKPIGKKLKLQSDADGFVKSLDMTILYWKNGYTQLVGKKKGAYDRLKDQRMNDGEAIIDVVSGALLRNTLIGDVIAHTKLSALRAMYENANVFVHVPEDLKGVELVTADDKRVSVALAEQFHMYEPRSLQWELGRDGKLYFTLTIDPVNPEAVNNRRQDPELIDLYVLDPAGDGKATRLARLPSNDRRFGWHHSAGTWAVLRKHKGFGRGGGELELYTLTAK